MRYYHMTHLCMIWNLITVCRRPSMVSDVIIIILSFFSVIFTGPYYFMHSMWSVGRTIGFSQLRLYASLVFILIALTDYYWHVRTKYEYLMLLSHWMCIKNWDYHNWPCCWRAKSRTSNSKLQIFSTLHRKIKTIITVCASKQANKEQIAGSKL